MKLYHAVFNIYMQWYCFSKFLLSVGLILNPSIVKFCTTSPFRRRRAWTYGCSGWHDGAVRDRRLGGTYATDGVTDEGGDDGRRHDGRAAVWTLGRQVIVDPA